VVGKVTFFRNLPPELSGQAIGFTAIFVMAAALNAPLALSGRLAFGLHLGHAANLTAMWAQLLTLAAMAVTVWLRAPFAVFLLVSILPAVLCNLALGIWLLRRLDPSPGKMWEGLEYSKHTVRSGLQYLALGASQPLFFALGPLLLSSVFGPAVVTAYGLTTRALGVVHNLEAGVLGATWPALTESLGRGDHARARRCLRRNVLLTCVAFCLPVLLFPFLGPPVLSLWSGLPAASFPAWIVWPVTLLFFCVLFQGPFYIFLSAAGSVAVLAASHFVAAGVAFGAAAFLRGHPHWIPVWLAASYAAFALIPPIAQSLRILKAAAAR
jgi:O-antigen/teichoic acid export membrane protein